MSQNGLMTLVEFLEARFAEDESAAHVHWENDYEDGPEPGTWYQWVLAEVAAKRAIVALCSPDPSMPVDSGRFVTAGVLTLLAEPYADHPDYDESWRP